MTPVTTHSIFAGSARIGNVADPSSNTDVATKGYVDTAVGGVSIPSGTTGQTLRHNGSAWVANSTLYNNGTNVGIGTTAVTAARVTLADHTTTAGGIRFRTAATAVDLYSSGSGVLKTAASFEAGSYKVGTTNVIDSSRNIIAGNGTVAAPSVRSSSYTTTGLAWLAGPTLAFSTAGAERMRVDSTGNVGIGTTSPTVKLAVTGNVLIDGNLTLSKLTASTIDPLYRVKGINYSSFAPSIVGGVKEEYVGRIYVNKEAIIDFDKEKAGSDLWVWRQVVDFNRDNVEILMTPYGQFAQVYYLIKGNKIIFRSDRPVEVSYRLIGKRFDWAKWPTLSPDQETAGYEVY